MKKMILFLAVATTAMLTSCGGSTIFPQNEDNGKQVKDLVIKNFGGDKQVSAITLLSQDELYAALGSVTIQYKDGDKKYEQTYADGKVGEPKEEMENAMAKQASELIANIQNKVGVKTEAKKDYTVALESINYDQIPYQVGAAAAMLESEYEKFVLRSYTVRVVGENELQVRFVIHAQKIGEAKEMRGRKTVTSYYDFTFEVQKDGTVDFAGI
ncbi:hypothetical protein [Myroides phaeus]|uniref:Lipoprotein n=1 Tax=Myroides phaeus TaxID=702745 RepID=A0A1G8CN47_9FLAO|nr:hypothetical protein [Myroides phaeus]MEC4117451.1 hypothetical protein [Myroides phaeus]SDH46794.1 hypothetical protein SAMN05421818_104133 [Myroides phaeus]